MTHDCKNSVKSNSDNKQNVDEFFFAKSCFNREKENIEYIINT